jgi:extradiol dioxygenase family protein
MTPRFHLAIPVHDLAAARRFYGELLGCAEGRSDRGWVDFNLHGHQLVCHEVGATERAAIRPVSYSDVDGHQIPVPHFGLVMTLDAWQALADQLEAGQASFALAPMVRFAGTAGEQRTLFLEDPSGNMLEFKGFADIEGELFKR